MRIGPACSTPLLWVGRRYRIARGSFDLGGWQNINVTTELGPDVCQALPKALQLVPSILEDQGVPVPRHEPRKGGGGRQRGTGVNSTARFG